MEEVVGGELATEIVHLKKVAFLIPTRLKLYLDSLSGTRFAGTTSPCFLQLPQKTSSFLTNQGLWYMDRLIKGTKNLGDVKKQGKDMRKARKSKETQGPVDNNVSIEKYDSML